MSRIVLVLALAFAALSQRPSQEEERTRQLWDTNLLNKRPAAKKARPLSPAKSDDALVGITLWRLRPSQPTDEPAVRALIHEDQGTREWTPERIAADTPLREGMKIRISIEAARAGYLYVVDRDQYADGSKGDPYLIFPTGRTRRGNNTVGAGTVIEIPASDDNPPYFRVERSRTDQVSELLLFLVCTDRMKSLQIGRERLKLTDAQVADWEKQSKAAVRRLEAFGQVGKPLTLAEKQAAIGRSQLTADDPLPQTMYRLDVKPGALLLLEVPLRIEK